MTRSMTPQEKTDYKAVFPKLDVVAAVVSDEATNKYNCIAWTIGVTNAWIWPGNSLADFDKFYAQNGYSRTANGPIALWGASTSSITHGCLSGAGHGPRWESKCGEGLRIQHGLTELENASYGRVLAFYAKSARAEAPFQALLGLRKRAKASEMRLSLIERKSLARAVATVPKPLQARFRSAFVAWKGTWFAGGLAFDSNPNSRATGPQFDALIALGPDVMPLLIAELADESNFLALVLYDRIQADHRLVVQFESDDPRVLEGEQGRARQVVRSWLAR